MIFSEIKEDAPSGSRAKRANDNGDGDAARAKAPKKDLSMTEIEQALRNQRVNSDFQHFLCISSDLIILIAFENSWRRSQWHI